MSAMLSRLEGRDYCVPEDVCAGHGSCEIDFEPDSDLDSDGTGFMWVHWKVIFYSGHSHLLHHIIT